MIFDTIRTERLTQRLTLEQLASRTGIAAPNLSRLESGHVDPRLSTVTKVLRALGLSLTATPIEQITLADVQDRMALGAKRLREAGMAERSNLARLEWKEHRGLDTSVERRVLGLD